MGLEEYLHERASEGMVDSRGAFTLNLTRAFQQMGQRVARHPYDFLLRAVQAAVAAGAPTVEICQTSSGLRLAFEADLSPLSTLTTWLGADLEVAPSRAQKHLASALLMAPPDWELRLQDASLTRRGEEIEQSDRCGFGVAWSLHHLASTGVSLKSHLEERLAFCPVPISLNGKRILRRWTTLGDRSDPIGGVMDLAWGLQLSTLEEDVEGFSIPAPPLAEMDDLSDGWKLWDGRRGWFRRGTAFSDRRPAWLLHLRGLPQDGPVWQVKRAIRASLSLQRAGRLRLIVDGVALQPKKMKGLRGIDAVVWAPWAMTDLSGLEAVENDDYLVLLNDLTLEVQELDSVLLRHASRIEMVRRGKARGGSGKLLRAVIAHTLRDMVLGDASKTSLPEPPGYLYLGVLLRRGAMATFLAWDRQREVMVTLHAMPTEAHYQARVHHYCEVGHSDRIVPVLDFFTHQQTFYLVFPYLPGESLPRLLPRLLPGEKERLLAEVVEATAEIHQRWPHGGLTPGRFYREKGGRVRVLVNLAELLLPAEARSSGTGLSWQRYTAPEVTGKEQDGALVDLRASDRYSLGMILRLALLESASKGKAQLPPVGQKLAEAIERLTRSEPAERPTDLGHIAALLRQEAERR